MLSQLEPQLEHNRKKNADLRRRKRQVLIALVVCSPLLVFIFPESALDEAVIGALAIAAVGFGYYDFRRWLVFKADLRERKDAERQR